MEWTGYWKRRRLRRIVRDRLRMGEHVLHMREDVLPLERIRGLKNAMGAAVSIMRGGDADALEGMARQLSEEIDACWPARKWASVRENVEVLVVAVAVAMACRAYFIQPFQIPTGSMQPTLYGIHSWAAEPGVMDLFPLKMAKWLVFGEWYRDIRVKETGFVSPPYPAGNRYPSHFCLDVAGRAYRIPKDAAIEVRPGEEVEAGTRIWHGIEHRGDHVFVDKVSWNFRRPHRGEVMVFRTDGIVGLPPGTYYIKRMVGLPGERVSIRQPDLLVDGEPMRLPASLARIAECEPGYAGYRLAGSVFANEPRPVLWRPSDTVNLGPGQYLALGDNTLNSKDSRYWGPVREENLVGPGMLVYWPVSRRWGRTR